MKPNESCANYICRLTFVGFLSCSDAAAGQDTPSSPLMACEACWLHVQECNLQCCSRCQAARLWAHCVAAYAKLLQNLRHQQRVSLHTPSALYLLSCKQCEVAYREMHKHKAAKLEHLQELSSCCSAWHRCMQSAPMVRPCLL